MKSIVNRMSLQSPKWAVVGQWISGIVCIVVLWFLCLKWIGIFEPSPLAEFVINPVVLSILAIAFLAFRLPIEKGQSANLQRLNGTFGQNPQRPGRCCPECSSKDFIKKETRYICEDCGAKWVSRK